MASDCLNWGFYSYTTLSIFRLAVRWKSFSCAEPVQVWLLCHEVIILLLRILHQCAHSMGHSQLRNQSDQFFLPVHGARRQRILSGFILAVMVPVFLVSDVVGVMWFLTYSKETCWPLEPLLNPEVVGLMLFLCSFFALVYVLFAFGVLCNRCRGRRQNLWGPPRTVNNEFAMSTLLLDCPEAECAKECTVYCSICQDRCREGQKIRTIVACGHQYHSECLERWLSYRPVCPNCMRNVNDPVEV
eukprot:gnl/MRDRNA2_/MRDRNA2_187520_c0_seq1.p1 gnl/MRDRNA2_/MRDRNA2_187520_c0~~gnl/MRDRNA2_/MRDRNA2_187520_c0_seq1.p1  ORF type:complete len:244 (+),score=13.36 gnl/MRDRNA2_/MRDRNA2_187520_c0_seq1:64-795(+)